MKTSEFIRQLLKEGIKFLKHGKNHDWYINLENGNVSQISRHGSQEIKTGTANRIRKDLGLK